MILVSCRHFSGHNADGVSLATLVDRSEAHSLTLSYPAF